jgi:murein DD-endopeptidase MepM/ murein hydrolase activator NlpD
MPRTRASVIVATLAAWLALALPAGAWYYPESPAETVLHAPLGGELHALDRVLPPEQGPVTGGSLAPTQPGTLNVSTSAAAPHKALAGWIRQEILLPDSRFSLARPFTEPYRQSPEPTYPYGSRGSGRYVLHTGVDIVNPMGTPVRALADGQVVYAGSDSNQIFGPRPGFYGNLVITQLNAASETEPVYALFGHLDKILVAQGQQVRAGDVVGLVGMAGIAIGPHLHLEIRQGQNSYSATRNPVLWLSNLPGRGTLAGRVVDQAGRPVSGERLLIYRAEKPSRLWRVVRTYLESPVIHSDVAAGENFALADVPAGDYRIVAGRPGATVQIPVRIEPGRLTLVEISVDSNG